MDRNEWERKRREQAERERRQKLERERAEKKKQEELQRKKLKEQERARKLKEAKLLADKKRKLALAADPKKQGFLMSLLNPHKEKKEQEKKKEADRRNNHFWSSSETRKEQANAWLQDKFNQTRKKGGEVRLLEHQVEKKLQDKKDEAKIKRDLFGFKRPGTVDKKKDQTRSDQ